MPTPRRTARTNVDSLIAAAIAAQDQARQTRSYAVIGRLYTLESDKGRVQFDRHAGPGIAQELDGNGDFTGQLLFVSGWDKLPPVQEYSEEFCPKCLAKCDVCHGKGKSLCIMVGCGGRGTVPGGEDPCPACTASTGKFDPACTVCGGHGAIALTNPCPCCAGTGQANCGACRGTGKRPTGRSKDGKAMCEHCHGSQRDGSFKQQDLGKAIAGRIGNNFVIGPIAKLILAPVQANESVDRNAARWNAGDSRGGTVFLRISPERDRNNQPMLVLLPMNAGDKAVMPYFFGGSVL